LAEHSGEKVGSRRLDADPAAGAHAGCPQAEHRRQAPGSALGAAARSSPVQRGDPHAVLESHSLREQRLRHRSRLPAPLRPARSLSLGPAATRAAVPKGTTAFNPYRHPARMADRKKWILGRMVQLGFIDAEQAEAAAVEPVDLQAFTAAFRAPHFSELIAANLDRWGLGEATVIQTSLDPKLQLEIESLVGQALARLRGRRVGSAAVLVVDNRTTEVLAYVGSPDFFNEALEGQNDS